jgi:DNA-binding transcriptional LysR family regulator
LQASTRLFLCLGLPNKDLLGLHQRPPGSVPDCCYCRTASHISQTDCSYHHDKIALSSVTERLDTFSHTASTKVPVTRKDCFVEIDQLKAFLAVLAHGGFHRAAGALNVTQPAISGRIRALEVSLGVTLFARGHANPTLTPAGKALRPHAEQLLRTIALARQAVHELQPSAGSALRIAASLSICTYFLPEVMQDYQRANPKVMVNLRSGNSAQVLKMVLEGEADIGIARSLNHPEVATMTLRDDPLILVGHPSHPAAKRKLVRMHEVESWPLIFYNRGSSDWTISQSLFRRAGLLPNTVLEVETIEAAKRMVQRKLGFCFLPQIALTEELRRGSLVTIEIANAEPLSRNLDVIHPLHRPLTKEAEALLQILRAAAAEPVALKKMHAKRRKSKH